MTRRTATIAVALAALAVPATAGAQDSPTVQRTEPKLIVPKKAKKMTGTLAKAHTQDQADKEMMDTSKWPADETRDLISGCKVLSKRRGRCDYRLSYTFLDDAGVLRATWCDRRVTVKIAKKTRRVSSKVADLGCRTE